MDRVAMATYAGAKPIYIGWIWWPRQSTQDPSRLVNVGWGGQADTKGYGLAAALGSCE